MIKAYGNKFDGNKELLTQNDTASDNIDCYLASTRDEVVPSTYTTKAGGTTYNNFDTASGFYTYTPDTPEVAKANVEKYAGRMNGGDLHYTFNNAVEDSNYDIIPDLANKIKNYASKLVKAMGSSSAGGDDGAGDGNEGDVPTEPTPPVDDDSGHTATPTAMNTDYFTYTKAAYDSSNACIKMEAGTGIISFTTNGSTTLSIVFCGPGNSDTAEVTVKQGNTVVPNTAGAEASSVTGKTQTTFAFNLPNAGTYTINATSSKAVRVFKINVAD